MVSHLPAMVPVACGCALAFRIKGEPRVALGWSGEGASNVGDFHEALNFAGVQQLPVIFICENNQYAYSVPVENGMTHVAIGAEGYGFDGVAINGNDVLAVYQAQGRRSRARAGDGPTLIECKTYRWHGHSEHDKAFYRDGQSWRCGRAAIRFRRSRPTCARATCSTIRNSRTSRRRSPRPSTRRSSSR